MLSSDDEYTDRRTQAVTDPDDEDFDLKFLLTQPKGRHPIVVEKYKLVFFHIPKVACTEFKLLFMKMKDKPGFDVNAILGAKSSHRGIHPPSQNGLKYLSDYSKEDIRMMIKSDEWTKAVFLREPKERVLSAFLDKAVRGKGSYFTHACCNKGQVPDPEECHRRAHDEKDFSYFLQRTRHCRNMHWVPQARLLDKTWWQHMTFVGYMNNLAGDSETLFRSLKDPDGTTAWDRYASTGWGSNGNGAFMVRDEAVHATSAHDKLRQYYSSCDEEFLEKHWRADWHIPGMKLEEVELYDHSVQPCTK